MSTSKRRAADTLLATAVCRRSMPSLATVCADRLTKPGGYPVRHGSAWGRPGNRIHDLQLRRVRAEIEHTSLITSAYPVHGPQRLLRLLVISP
jgi:hypothetical protein